MVSTPEPSPPASSLTAPRPTRVSSGNPRITVAFPFSKITIGRQDETLAEIADLVRDLAEHTAALAEQVGSERLDAIQALVQHARALAQELDQD